MEVNLQLENFQGPLSLLYHLIEKNKIDIYDIPISQIADQYLEVLEGAQRQSMEVMSEFVLMAATLLEIKSRMLLPKPKVEEEEGVDPRAELVAKLIEYKKFKNVTEALREKEDTASVYIYKEVSPNIEAFKKEDEITIDQLLDGITFEHIYNIFKEVMKRKEQKVDRVRSSFKSVERDLYTVEEQIEYIKDLLVLSPQVRFVDIFRDNVRKMELVVTFMALLEMIKMKTVSIVQEGIFKDIFITMYTGSDRNEN